MKALTKEQAVAITACTGTMMFKDGKVFKQAVEERLQREVSLEEWATDSFREMVTQLYLDDFLNLCYTEQGRIITL